LNLRFLIAEFDLEESSRSHQPNPEQGRGPPSSTRDRASGWDQDAGGVLCGGQV